MLIAKNGTQYNQITNEIIKAHATYVNSPFVKVNRALNYRRENGISELVDDFTPEELKAGLTEIVKIADVETRELYINKFFSSNKSEAQQIITRTLANKETYNKTEVNNLLNAKANQATTYNKTEVNNLLNAKANQATTYTKTEVMNLVNTKANWNAIVNLNGNQIIAGVKTFSALPVCNILPTADAQLANRNYVKKRGGLVAVTGGVINLNNGINFSLNLTRATNITVAAAAANIGQTGEIYVANGANIRAFNAPFNFRVATSGFGANEVFSYLVVSANLVRITRS